MTLHTKEFPSTLNIFSIRLKGGSDSEPEEMPTLEKQRYRKTSKVEQPTQYRTLFTVASSGVISLFTVSGSRVISTFNFAGASGCLTFWHRGRKRR